MVSLYGPGGLRRPEGLGFRVIRAIQGFFKVWD